MAHGYTNMTDSDIITPVIEASRDHIVGVAWVSDLLYEDCPELCRGGWPTLRIPVAHDRARGQTLLLVTDLRLHND